MNIVAEKEITAEDNWSTVFLLPKYDENGKIIVYEIDEKEIPTGYVKVVDGNVIINSQISNYNLGSFSVKDSIEDNSHFRTEKLPITGKNNLIIFRISLLVIVIPIIIAILIILLKRKLNKRKEL